jgi:hypothetical protein
VRLLANLLDEHKGPRFPPLDRFLSMQRTGEYEHRRLGYQKLHKEVNRINAIVRRAGHGELKKMPFEWVDRHSTYRQDKVIGLPSRSQPNGAAADTSTKTSRGAGQKT